MAGRTRPRRAPAWRSRGGHHVACGATRRSALHGQRAGHARGRVCGRSEAARDARGRATHAAIRACGRPRRAQPTHAALFACRRVHCARPTRPGQQHVNPDRPHAFTRRQALAAGLAAAGGLLAPRAVFPRATHPVVRTTYGDVRGFMDAGIAVFRGVRYGADTRPRRFMPPLPPARWDVAADAFEYGAAAPQDRTGERISEDCLFLNVWTPGLDDGRRPVMFYIHGGAYAHGSGSSPLYDGRRLASTEDVVVVTVN